MPDDLVCTLTAANYEDREAAWLKVGSYVRASETVPGGLSFRFAPSYVRASETVPGGLSFRFAPAQGLGESLSELVRLEAECCAWMGFAMSESPDGISLSITSNSEDGERAVREAFAPLVRTSTL